MKYFIFSDLHGSSRGMNAVLKALEKEKPDRILLLGDILHGGYDGGSSFCADALRELAPKILAVKGNCDYEEDAEELGFPLPERRYLDVGLHRIHMSHAPYALSFPPGDMVFYGHTHRKTLYSDHGAIILNPGSASYPRDGGPASYAIMEDRTIRLMSLEDGSVLSSLDF